MEASNDYSNSLLELKNLQLICNTLHNMLYILPYLYLKQKTKQKEKEPTFNQEKININSLHECETCVQTSEKTSIYNKLYQSTEKLVNNQ